MRGAGWRKRHNGVKLCIRGLLRWAGLDFDCEVFNLFAHNIPQAGLARIERERRCQGLVQQAGQQGGEEKLSSSSSCKREKGAAGLPSPGDGGYAEGLWAFGLVAR